MYIYTYIHTHTYTHIYANIVVHVRRWSGHQCVWHGFWMGRESLLWPLSDISGSMHTSFLFIYEGQHRKYWGYYSAGVVHGPCVFVCVCVHACMHACERAGLHGKYVFCYSSKNTDAASLHVWCMCLVYLSVYVCIHACTRVREQACLENMYSATHQKYRCCSLQIWFMCVCLCACVYVRVFMCVCLCACACGVIGAFDL
jgi:hypothetical protein